jgi:ribosome-binding protein aMBF1 (putative translation factor)
MTPGEVIEEIREAGQAFVKAVQAYYDCKLAFMEAQRSLDAAEAAMILSHDPKELGANEQQRRAKIAEILSSYHEEVRARRRAWELSKRDLRIATAMFDQEKAVAAILSRTGTEDLEQENAGPSAQLEEEDYDRP